MLAYRFLIGSCCAAWAVTAASIPTPKAESVTMEDRQLVVPGLQHENNDTKLEQRFYNIHDPNLYAGLNHRARPGSNVTEPHFGANQERSAEPGLTNPGPHTWRTTFKVLIDKTGGDFGVHSEIKGLLYVRESPSYQPLHFYDKMPKKTNFRTGPHDHAREILDWPITTQDKPVQWFRLKLRESDFFGPLRFFLDETKNMQSEPLDTLRNGKEVCADVIQGGNWGYEGRLRRCIQYQGPR